MPFDGVKMLFLIQTFSICSQVVKGENLLRTYDVYENCNEEQIVYYVLQVTLKLINI